MNFGRVYQSDLALGWNSKNGYVGVIARISLIIKISDLDDEIIGGISWIFYFRDNINSFHPRASKTIRASETKGHPRKHFTMNT